jgi:phytoene dehydrogenase-like protein
MADQSFDVVIVGGGMKALALAAYLTKFGKMSVGIFDKSQELGGIYNQESPISGFNVGWHRPFHWGPIVDDIPELAQYGVVQEAPLLSFGTYFVEDDSWIGVYHPQHDPTGERTAKLWEKFSAKDAESWLYYHEKIVKRWVPAALEWAHSLPSPFNTPNPVTTLMDMPEETGGNPHWMYMSFYEVTADMFESPECRLALLRLCLSLGSDPWSYMMGIYGMASFAWAYIGAVAYRGGIHSILDALQKVIIENGGKTFTNTEVEKIVVENSKAKGIRLADGSVIKANTAVVCTPTPWHLVNLAGKDYFSERVLNRLGNASREFSTVASYTWALNKRPKYKGAQFHPDIEGMNWMGIGTKEVNDLLMDVRRHKAYKLPDTETPGRMMLTISDHSWGAPDLDPAGKACALTECYVSPAFLATPQDWKEFERRHAEDVIHALGNIAPNITWDNVAGYSMVTPYKLQEIDPLEFGSAGIWTQLDVISSQIGIWRPCAELSSHRVPDIEGLYATGSSWGIAGGAGSQGYTCYKAMAKDFSLTVPGLEGGRGW